jgi:hypothetical protein
MFSLTSLLHDILIVCGSKLCVKFPFFACLQVLIIEDKIGRRIFPSVVAYKDNGGESQIPPSSLTFSTQYPCSTVAVRLSSVSMSLEGLDTMRRCFIRVSSAEYCFSLRSLRCTAPHCHWVGIKWSRYKVTYSLLIWHINPILRCRCSGVRCSPLLESSS